jgi:hypothetical protein
LLVDGVLPAKRTELFQLHSVRMFPLVSRSRIITIFAIFTSQYNNISHFLFLSDGVGLPYQLCSGMRCYTAIRGMDILLYKLFNNAGYNAGTDSASTFTDSKA